MRNNTSLQAIVFSCVIAGLVSVAPATARAQTSPSTAATAVTRDDSTRTNLKGVIADSLKLVLMEHLTRVAIQSKTRKELDGPFFGD